MEEVKKEVKIDNGDIRKSIANYIKERSKYKSTISSNLNFKNVKRNERFLEQSIKYMILKLSDDMINYVGMLPIVECTQIPDNNANYISCNISIEIGSYQWGFKIQELMGNCSSVSIHYFTGNELIDTGYDHSLFKKQETFNTFMLCLEDFIMNIIGYSAILYTITSESRRGFKEYCEDNLKEIESFTNKRNKHIVKYYLRK